MGKGRLFVVSGPSGVGKGTVIARIMEADPAIWKSVSATTRAPRAGEADGVDYYFVERSDFERTASGGGFLEWAEYSGNLYGTPVASVQAHLDAGENVVLEIEVQGAMQVRKSAPEAVLLFVAPPSMEELERRLRGRGSESEDSVRARMDAARVELSHEMEYDYVFVNDDIDGTVEEMLACIGNAGAQSQETTI